jgi:hypothetical protein
MCPMRDSPFNGGSASGPPPDKLPAIGRGQAMIRNAFLDSNPRTLSFVRGVGRWSLAVASRGRSSAIYGSIR